MVQKIKKKLFRILPLSVVFILVLALAVGIYANWPSNEVQAVNPSITINSVHLVLQIDTNANNYANIGDHIRIRADINNTDAGSLSCPSTTTATVDLTAYGGGLTDPMSCVTADGAGNLIFQADFVILNAGVSGIQVGANNPASAVTVTLADTDETVTPSSNNLGDGVIDTTATNGVDTVAPKVGSAVTADGNGDGQIDSIAVTYSEAVNDPDYDMVDVGRVMLPLSPFNSGSGTTTLIYNYSQNGSPDTGATLSITWTDIGADAADLAGNNLDLTGAPAASTDGANPVVVSAKITAPNTITVVYSEAVSSISTDYTNLVLTAGGARAVTGSGGTGTDTIFMSFSGAPAASNETATMDIGATVVDISPATNALVPVVGQSVTDGQAPSIVYAVAQDTGADGILDRVVLTFDENLADTAAAANGFDITSAADHGSCTGESADPDGTNVLNVDFTCTTANTSVGDLTLNFTANAGIEDAANNQVGSVVLAIYSTPAITDGASPVILSGVYTDGNGDGRVDQIVFTTSTDVGISCGTFTPGPDYTINNAGNINLVKAADWCTSDGISQITINMALGGDPNKTGGAVDPIVTYTQPGNGFQDGAVNYVPTSGPVSLSDSAVPSIQSATYTDADGDGMVDHVVFTTTDDTGITCTSFAGGSDFTVGTAGEVSLASDALDTCTSNGTSNFTITLHTIGAANSTGGATSPLVTYTQPGNGVEDGAGNDLPTAAGVTVSDGASPIILSGTYTDADGDGMVDNVAFTTTNDTGITCTSFTGNTDFTVGTAGEVGLTSDALDTCSSNGVSNLMITLHTLGAANTTGGPTDPVVTYTQPGNGVEDGAGNDLPTAAGVIVSDGAAPIPVTAVMQDINADGIADRIVLTFSEAMADTPAGNNGFGISSTSGHGSCFSQTADPDGTAIVNVDYVCDGVDTAVDGQTLAFSGNAGITDLVGHQTNPLTIFNAASTPAITDGAAPVITNFAYQDVDFDGKIDRFTLTYSEPVVAASTLSADDLNLFSDGGFTGAGFGSDTTDLITGTTTNTIVNLGIEATAVLTHNSGPIRIFTQSAFSLEDAALNINSAGVQQTQASYFDGASPVIVSTSPVSGVSGLAITTNVVVTFSEPMNTGTVTKTSTPNPGGWVPVWSGGNSIVTYSHTAFANNTMYTQQITAGDDPTGNSISAHLVPNPWSFTTVAGGGGGGGGSAGNPVDSTPPSNTSIVIAGGAAETTSQAVTLTLGASADAVSMMISNTSDFYGVVWETFNTTKTWSLTDGHGTKTVYAKFRDAAGNASSSVADTISYVASATNPAATTPPETTTPTTPPATQLPGQVSSTDPKTGLTISYYAPTNRAAFLLARNVNADKACEDKYGPLLSADAKAFAVAITAAQLEEAVTFVCYGINSDTDKLGAGERRALMRDYWNTTGYAAVFWDDIVRNAVGQKYVHRNLKLEQIQVPTALRVFRKIFGHDPNFKVLKEDMTWNTILYRLRFVRDLNLERAGIVKFRSIFGHTPTTPLDWAVVRALGYIK